MNVSTHHDGKGGIDIKIDEWVYVHINYNYRYTDNAHRAWLAREIVSLLNRPDDNNLPITREWLASIGFKPVPSDMGPNYADHMERDGINLWLFNDRHWCWNDCDRIPMVKRVDLRNLGEWLGVLI